MLRRKSYLKNQFYKTVISHGLPLQKARGESTGPLLLGKRQACHALTPELPRDVSPSPAARLAKELCGRSS